MTVLIMGAGASKDFHPEMGTGADLVEGVLNRVVEDHLPHENRYLSHIFDQLKADPCKIRNPELRNLVIKYERDDHIELFSSFHTKLKQYMNENNWKGSIDAFLSKDENNEFLTLGKFVVAFHIMGYEGISLNHFGRKNTWLYHLAIKMEKVIYKEDELENLKIITFNYDRLIEHYLHCYFNRVGKWNDTLLNFTKGNIMHTYGSLGELPFQNQGQFTVYALENNKPENMESTMNNFQLMYEERNKQEMKERKKEAWDWIAGADKIYLLGFGYDKYNMNILNIPSNKQAIGTAYGIDGKKRSEIKKSYRLPKIKFMPKEMTCAEFVKSEYFVL